MNVSSRHDEDPVPTNVRMAHAASYLANRPQVRERLEPAILEWIADMHTQGGWELAKPWLDVAEKLRTDEHARLLEPVVGAMSRMIRAEQDFTNDHADRFVALTERVPNTGVVPRGPPNRFIRPERHVHPRSYLEDGGS